MMELKPTSAIIALTKEPLPKHPLVHANFPSRVRPELASKEKRKEKRRKNGKTRRKRKNTIKKERKKAN